MDQVVEDLIVVGIAASAGARGHVLAGPEPAQEPELRLCDRAAYVAQPQEYAGAALVARDSTEGRRGRGGNRAVARNDLCPAAGPRCRVGERHARPARTRRSPCRAQAVRRPPAEIAGERSGVERGRCRAVRHRKRRVIWRAGHPRSGRDHHRARPRHVEIRLDADLGDPDRLRRPHAHARTDRPAPCHRPATAARPVVAQGSERKDVEEPRPVPDPARAHTGRFPTLQGNDDQPSHPSPDVREGHRDVRGICRALPPLGGRGRGAVSRPPDLGHQLLPRSRSVRRAGTGNRRAVRGSRRRNDPGLGAGMRDGEEAYSIAILVAEALGGLENCPRTSFRFSRRTSTTGRWA